MVFAWQVHGAGTEAAALFSGSAVDGMGRPVAGAEVDRYLYGSQEVLLWPEIKTKEQTTSDSQGAFTFPADESSGILVVKKAGLATAWKARGFHPGSSTESLALEAPSALAGLVVDENGQPVEGAEVWVTMATDEARSALGMQPSILMGQAARDSFSARTGADGHFRIENFPADAQADLAVSKAGKALPREDDNPAAFRNGLPYEAGQEGINLVLQPTASIEGKVAVQATGAGLAGVRLRLQPATRMRPFMGLVVASEPAVSGADGQFRIADVAAGTYNVLAEFEGKPVADWVALSNQVTAAAGETARNVQVWATKGGWVEVTVSSADDGKPVAAAEVSAFSESEARERAVAAGENGVARLRLAPGQWSLTASKRGWVQQRQGTATVEEGQTNRIDIGVTPLDFIATKGIVRGPGGQPIAGASLAIRPNLSILDDALSDADGHYELTWATRTQGQYMFPGFSSSTTLTALSADKKLVVVQGIDESTTNLDLQLQPALTLSARVQDAAGKPITNATAEARRISGNSQFQMNARADRQGRLRVAGQPQGQRYEMTVFAKGYGSAHQEVGEAETLTTNCEFAPFVLARADRKLAGQVLDAEGKPAAGVQLQLNGEGQPGGWAKTDATGHFLFDAVCAGPVSLNARVQVGPANYVGSLTQAEGGDTNVVFRLDRNNQNGARAAVASKITGTVTDPAGAPAAGVRVALYPNNFGASEAVTDAQGRYSISIQNVQSMNGQDVSPCLVARSLQRNLAAARDIDAKTTNLDLRLEPALTISAKAEDAGGHPITNATASLIFMTGYMGMQMDAKPKRADELGRLRLEALPPGRQYTVNIMAPGYGASAPVTVPAGQKTTNFVCPTFVLRRADRKLAGQVVGLDGTALAGVQLSIRGEGQPNAFARSDATGHFSFAAVCEGPVTVFANYQGGPRRGYLNATVQAQGGDTNVAVRFVANNNFGGQGVIVTTSGRVLDAAGAPAPGVAVTLLTGYGGNMEGVQSDADGKYLINWRLNRQINTPTSILARNLAQNLAAIREIDDAATNVDLRLEPGLTLAVKVEDAAGKPIRSAAVTLSYSTGMSSFSLANGSPNNSDAQGGIQFTALPQGKQYIVSINAAGYGTASRTLTPGETKTTNLVCPTFVLRAADRQLAGQVLGVDGKPVPGTQLNIQGDGQPFGNAQSDATGRFSFPSVSDGPINISASYQGGGGRFFLTTTAQARGGDTNVTVQFVANNNFGGQGVTVTTRGTVYDPSGAPVPGVALALESGFGGGAVEIQSDAAGKYSLTWKSNPQMNSAPSLLARSVERNLATVHNLDETTTNLDLHLEEGLTITTKVQDARGKPIADASAGLFGFSENRGYPMNAPPARADDQGRIRFENLPPGQKYSLNIAATGYGSASQQVEAGETKVKNYDFPAVTLRLADRKLAGQVLGPDGKPVADANVSTQGDGQPTLTARTDATGHFSFAAVGEGPVTLNANSQGGARGYLNASIQAQGGDTNAVIHFAINGQFGPSAQVVTTSGTVTDPAGAPVAGARLMVMTGYGGNNAEIQSEADGKFSVTWQRPNFNGAIPMIPFILARQTARDLAGTADLDETTNNLDLHLQPGLTLAVKVQDGAGKPIPTATASLTTWSGNRGFSFEPAPASANALGLIEIKCLPQERRYSAHITAPGYGSVNAEAQIGDTKTTRFEFPPAVLRLANQKLAGQVLGPDDKPVAGAFVNVQPINGQPGGNTTSDAQGHFAFNAVCDGPIQLNANTQGGANFMAGNVQAQGGDTNVVLRLNVNGQAMPANGRSVTTTGTVLNPDGAPVAGVRLSVLPLSAGNTEVKSDDAGKFSLTWRWQPPGARGGAAAARAGGPAIPALQFLLVARDLEHHWATAVDVDEKTTNVEVRLQAPLTITGSVVDPQGAPVKNAMISLMMWAGRSAATFQQAQAAFDTQGAFSITPLPQSQHYSLTVRATGYGNDSRQVQATETDTESLALPPFTLKPANLKLEGRVVDASDKPVPGAQVNLGGVGQPTDNTVTDAKGHFAFTHVCEGPVRVTAFDRSAGNGPMVPSSAQAQGGDTDVVVKLGVTPTGARVVAQAAPRMSPLKPAPWSWDALSQWPMDHVEAVMALAGLQVMALMVTAGCLFWFTRRQRD